MYIVTALERIIGNTIMAPVSSFGNMFKRKNILMQFSNNSFMVLCLKYNCMCSSLFGAVILLTYG